MLLSVVNELKDILEDSGLAVSISGNTVKGVHDTLPVAVVISIDDENEVASIELEALDDLEDAMSELVESGEDLRAVVDDVLAELRDIAIEVSRILKNKGYRVSLSLREGENDVRDLMDDILEEYGESAGVEIEEE